MAFRTALTGLTIYKSIPWVGAIPDYSATLATTTSTQNTVINIATQQQLFQVSKIAAKVKNSLYSAKRLFARVQRWD